MCTFSNFPLPIYRHPKNADKNHPWLPQVLGRKGKHEELQVATRNITAAVAQLSSLSKTKSMAENSADGESAQQLVVSRCAHVIETGADVLVS